jgi:hypothetical protein
VFVTVFVSTLRATGRRPDPASNTRGIAGVEFALILPVIILFVIGVFDISKAMILYEEVYNAAHTIPLSASIVAVQPDKSTSLTVDQTQWTMSAIYAEMPWVRAGIETGTRSVTMSEVVFQPRAGCTANATTNCYNANLAWSEYYNDNGRGGFGQVLRPCGTLTQTAANAGSPGDLSSIRTLGVTSPDPILVVDVHYRYTPLFFNFLTGPIDFWASGYWPARSVAPGATAPTATDPGNQWTFFDIAKTLGGAGKCPGFTTQTPA